MMKINKIFSQFKVKIIAKKVTQRLVPKGTTDTKRLQKTDQTRIFFLPTSTLIKNEILIYKV